jgi:hypothetical protein
MKFFKVLFYIFGSLFAIVLLVVGGALLIDNYQTSYLRISGHPEFEINSYVIKNVHVVPMTSDTVLRNHTVIIRDGMIAEITPDGPVSELEVIDGKGKYLMPGLIDMHVHVWDEYELGLYLANGVTAVRNLWGQPMHLRMKNAINSGQILAPMFYTSGPKLTGPAFMGDDNLQLFTQEEAKSKIIEYKERGYDFVKTYYGLTEELFDAVIAQAAESKMDVVAHPSAEVPYSYHFRPEIKTIEHAEDIVQQPLNYELDSVKLKEVVELYATSPDASLCPTLVVYYNIYRLLTEENILNSEELDYMNPLIKMVDSQAQLDRWSNTKANDSSIVSRIKAQHDFHLLAVRKLHEQGVTIVAGTDAGIGVTTPGYSIHQELDFYTQAGMTNYEALLTATVNPSKVHDFLNNQGTIQEGNLANMILTKQNPLDDLTALTDIEMVLVRGRKIEREKLGEFVAKAMTRSNMLVSGLRYAENLIVEK